MINFLMNDVASIIGHIFLIVPLVLVALAIGVVVCYLFLWGLAIILAEILKVLIVFKQHTRRRKYRNDE